MKPMEKNQTILLAGNPNVGKSTVFNQLTGMRQHTGNWPGKTVEIAEGICKKTDTPIKLIDLPGTYSLLSHSREEAVARDALCFGGADGVLVVCDATCPERNLNLVLQIMEITPRVAVCVNLMDEAERRGIAVSINRLADRLGVPVIGISAHRRRDLPRLISFLEAIPTADFHPAAVTYPKEIEDAVNRLASVIRLPQDCPISNRWTAHRLLAQEDGELEDQLRAWMDRADPRAYADAVEMRNLLQQELLEHGMDAQALRDQTVTALIRQGEAIAAAVTQKREAEGYGGRDRRLDRLLTGRLVGYPAMLLLLAAVFWITIGLSNVPSAWLASLFSLLQERLSALFFALRAPLWLHDLLILGVFRTLGWVVSVMLPPMAIFFPMFTLLEDAGYLPRIAYNLDRPFARCNACGKQALTMCMGFGCNAVGVTGCRIIDSPRERLLAAVTNSFVPCNGKFSTLITILSVFFVGASTGLGGTLFTALLLTAVILLGIAATFAVTKLLSVTLLRGVPSAFTLELPPYRRPRVGRVLLRSIPDRTLFVLGRAVAVAAPAGLLIWLMANLTVNDVSLLRHCADFLDPFARLMGLDGIILLAFILGFPANETVIPIILMGYLSAGSLPDSPDAVTMGQILASNGWTRVTALCFVLFFLFHWPCSTTLITVKRETASLRYTLLAAALPTLLGLLLCMAVHAVACI